jgi:mono/diheme cytochrome c family protein
MVAVLKNGTGKDMKSFAEKMSPGEMAAVTEYVRSLGSGGGQTSQ